MIRVVLRMSLKMMRQSMRAHEASLVEGRRGRAKESNWLFDLSQGIVELYPRHEDRLQY